MSLSFDRDFAVQIMIVLSVCVGAWMMAVEPKLQELTTLEQAIADNAAASTSMSLETFETLKKKVERQKERLAQIESFNQLAGDSSGLYGLVMDLADVHRVQVQSLQPGAAAKNIADSTTTVLPLDMVVEGTYDNIGAFLQAVSELEIFLRPVALQLSPVTVNGQPVVSAAFGCEVLIFSVADVFTELSGTANAKS